MAKGKKKKKFSHWPKKVKLQEALEVFENFRELCKYQMDVGYWATVDFPSKHHLNKILSLQYMDKEILEMAYGKGLVERAFSMMPYCKNYNAFVREAKEVEVKDEQDNSDSTNTGQSN